MTTLLDHFSRVEIIHLRSRKDRYRLLKKELSRFGLDLDGNKVHVPDAPIVEDDFGFESKQVYGNFLSHLDILRRAANDGVANVLILEDDVIFSDSFKSVNYQDQAVESLTSHDWDIAYLGHPRVNSDKSSNPGFHVTEHLFKWAHCYAVSHRILNRLVDYLEETIERESIDPRGKKKYIDGAINHFRFLHKEVTSIAHFPTLSIQRGSPSGIASRSWYDKIGVLNKPIQSARDLRDTVWKKTDIYIGKI